MFLEIHGQIRWCQTKGKGRSLWGQQVWPRLNCLSNTSQVEEEPLNYSFSSCPKKGTYAAEMQTFGANERKRKDAVFPRDALLPLAAWFSSFTSQPCGGEGDKPPAALSAGRLRGRGCGQMLRGPPKPQVSWALNWPGKDQVEGRLWKQLWRASRRCVVRRPRGAGVIREQPEPLDGPRKAQEVISALGLEGKGPECNN